ncbi:geranylgeranylglycerol-phosphate geranylgeranyltransferase [Flavobacterium sp. Fl-77]|uniref:Geranylgeranylglycerol-phosphate geranylgeranyltransferase n=1 Tax=Flavobacterium flavipigmentatum TaxID=2893884 RepID=A0AAJ2S9D1_9FLAO|nr:MULTISPECIES: geranylgeranylglycerol-phosphate geranylgeranyltransferase [unclassified Flavobacterium]MDX6181278.1 geranylgeranylglycerol-phosphate geranylgeranyltransferase [Flavobacterium sp. Fl-33]MDX6184879.1 geranylgeranylglycerol-phosphate geranylgeranyltransferase [Flavobacterium sp. Fl-77]UFH39971.1 geranylgeranylglycerol-phosphate geranylgeranyltransferase [Flavobacterium sp. F-70]
MLSRQHKLLVMKIVSLFSVVRGYNIPIIVLAQYLSAIFILAPEKRALDILLDFNLFLIVFASAITIASGYIINNFYDSQKDLINRPNKSMLDRLVSQKTKLSVYFTLNFIAALMALIVSWRAFLFFSAYIFLIWFYSHKIKKHVIIGNLTASLLAVVPFFAILLYFYNKISFEEIENHRSHFAVISAHAVFLFLLLLIREMIKDLENLKGDLVNNYKTIPILYGEAASKQMITFLTILTTFPVYVLINIYDVGFMDLYFYICFTVMIFFLLYLWKSNSKKQYLVLHNVLKFLIVSGVFCIVLINPSVLWHGKNLLLK